MSSTVAAPSTRFAQTRLERRAQCHRSRAVAWGEIVAVVLIAVLLVVAAVATSNRAHGGATGQTVRVESGQTLWSLAAAHPVAGLSTEQTADLIERVNDLDGAQLAVGRTIHLPGTAEDSLTVACR